MPIAFLIRLPLRALLCVPLLAAVACVQTPAPFDTLAAGTQSPLALRANTSAYDRACEDFERAMKAHKAGDTSGCKRLVRQAMDTLRADGLASHVRNDPLGVLDPLAYFAFYKAYVGRDATGFWSDVVQARYSAGLIASDGPGPSLPTVTDPEFDALVHTLEQRESAVEAARPVAPTTEPTVEINAEAEASGALAGTGTSSQVVAAAGNLESARGSVDGSVATDARAVVSLTGQPLSNDPTALAAQLDLARVQLALNNLDEARRILEEVLAEVERRALSGGREERAALALLSATYKLEGDFARAREIDQRRVAIAAKLPDDDPERLEAEDDLWAMVLALGEILPDASEQASGEQDGADGPQARRSGRTRRHTADVSFRNSGRSPGLNDVQLTQGISHSPPPKQLESDGRYEDAIAGYGVDLSDIELTSPSDVGARADAREGQARCYDALGDTDSAAELRQRNLDDLRKSLRDNDPRVQKARRALAGSRRSQGDLHGASTLQLEVCATLADTLPPDHPELVSARLWLSELLREVGETESALFALEQTLSAEVAGAVDRARLTALVRQARELQATCRFEEAIAVRREIVEAGRRALPPGSPAHSESVRELAALLRVAGERDEARALELQLGQNDDLAAGPEVLQVRAVESSHRDDLAQRYPPSVDLTLSPADVPGELSLMAIVRDPSGIASLHLVHDGAVYEVALRQPAWTPDGDGMGGRLELRLPAPTGRPVSVVTLVTENAAAGRTTRTSTVPVDR